MITPGNLNADERANEFAKAMRLISAATYSLSDLQRAQRTDLVPLALLKLVQSPDSEKLQGRSWESKEMRELEVQVDADVRKIVTEFYNQWKDQLYLNSQNNLCCRRKPSEKIYDHDAIVLPQLYHAVMLYRAHDDQGHQGADKVIARIRQRFIWPGLNNAVRDGSRSADFVKILKRLLEGKSFL